MDFLKYNGYFNILSFNLYMRSTANCYQCFLYNTFITCYYLYETSIANHKRCYSINTFVTYYYLYGKAVWQKVVNLVVGGVDYWSKICNLEKQYTKKIKKDCW